MYKHLFVLMKVFYRNKKGEKEKPQALQKLSDGSARFLLLLLGHSLTFFFFFFLLFNICMRFCWWY